jgi:hypothetical protein
MNRFGIVIGAFAVLLLSPRPCAAQTPLSVRRELIIPTSGLGVGNAVIALRDGGFAAVGYADDGRPTGTDVLFVRLDARGDTLWTRTYGGDGEDFGWDVVEAPDGGFFVVGFTTASAGGREDVLVLRLDPAGTVLWDRTFGEAGRDLAWSATPTPDGGIVIAAESEQAGRGDRDAYLLRLDTTGDLVWERAVDASGDQRVFQVTRTDDGAYVFAGTTAADRDANRNVYIIRVDAWGDTMWSRTFGDEPDDVGHGVMALTGGEVLVTGYGGTRTNGRNDVYLMRLDAEGNLRWWRHAGGPADDRAMMSARNAGAGYATVGYSVTSTGSDVMVLESDGEGNIRTSTVLERSGNDRGVMILPSGSGYVLTGMFGATQTSTGNFGILWLGRSGR